MAEKRVSVQVGLTLVLIMSLLAAAGPPANAANAAAGGTFAVGSQHTTDTDFQNAKVLDNLSVAGTGEDAAIKNSGPASLGSTLSRPDDNFTNTGIDNRTGVTFTANQDLEGIQFNVSSSTSGATTAYLINVDTSTVVAQKSLSGVQNRITSPLASGTTYAVALDADGGTYDAGGDSKDTASISGTYIDLVDGYFDGVNSNSWYGVNDFQAVLSTEETNGQYISANHSVDNAEESSVNVTSASNVSITLESEYFNGNSWVSANSTTISSTGNYTLDLPATDSSTWRLNATFSETGSNPSFELSDESILFDNHQPQASNQQPTDGTELNNRDVTFSVDISDVEFGLAQGDTVTAELYVDGSKVGENTTSSNSTVSVTHSISSGGDHTYHWEATDAYGATTSTTTQTITAPSELRIYNESAPSQLVDNATVDLLVYTNETGDAKVYERNTTDGTINMSGLPADQPFEVVAEAENYTSRRIFVPSLYETQSIYLLPDSEQSVTTIFELEDYTGRFPGENSVLLVQRGLNGTYRTVLGDFFGATGDFPGQLAYNTRHRLVIMNVKTGERRILGTHTPQTSSTKTVVVTPTGVTTFEQEPPAVLVQPQTRRLPAVSGTNLSVTLDPNDESIDSWSINASIVDNQSTTKVWDYSSTNAGTADTGLDLTGEHNGTLVVNVTYVVDGATLTETVEISIDKVWQNDASFIATLTQLADLSAPGTRAQFTSFMAMLVTIFVIGAVASVQSSGLHAGLAGVFVLTGFSLIGWVGYDVVFVAAVGLLGVTATQRGL